MKRAHWIKKAKEYPEQAGQAMIEFIFVILIIFVMMFAFVQLSWALAWGHYVHYATHMASRAYHAAADTQGDQVNNAIEALRGLLKNKEINGDIIGNIAKPRTGDARDIKGDEPIEGAFIGTHPVAVGNLDERSFSWAEGVQYNFKFKLFIFPFAAVLTRGDFGKEVEIGERNSGRGIIWDGFIGLSSDAFMGREVSVEECRTFMTELSNSPGLSRSDGEEFLFDNGC